MKTAVVVQIDSKGEIHADFSGYANRACELEEAELRRIMAEMGLSVKVKGAKPKQQNQQAQTRTTQAAGKRVRL